jgi:DnaJ-class molecular chaperone
MTCWVCGGKPWRDGFKGCVQCKSCTTCKGRKETATECATCNGKGRAGGVNPQLQIPTILCDACKGQAILRDPCKPCGQSGLADCDGCGGKGPRTANVARISDVWEAAKCDPCGGGGWPFRNLAVPCEKCLGLGSRLKPKADPKKTLE